jgi:FkbM family methyltransferase
MIRKADLYGFAESITPPFIFRPFKKSRLFAWLSRNAHSFTGTPPAKIVTITAGDLAGVTVKLNPDGHWQKEMIAGEYDHELFSRLKKFQLEGAVIYDIGAHVGYHSLAFATYVGEQGHVFSFEPNSANQTRAREMIALNPSLQTRITLLGVALSDHTGSTEFLSTDDVEGGTSSGGFIDDAATLYERDRYVAKAGFKTNTVALDTIDNLVATQKILPPNLLKVDVEGAEQLVLTGAQKTLATHRPNIIIEFHSIYSAYACMTILGDLHYAFELLKREVDGRIMIIATPH